MTSWLNILAQWAAATVKAAVGAVRSGALGEQALAAAVFAAIFAFGAISVDYLITGGPDWNPGGGQAYAMELPAAPTLLLPAPAQQPGPPPALLAFADEADYAATSEVLLGGLDWREIDAGAADAELKPEALVFEAPVAASETGKSKREAS